ncbi:MAG: YigZ family protein, partial [Ignavibacteria bacterium]|nr:YigZ family protein [Ignavibacteria bacterium]
MTDRFLTITNRFTSEIKIRKSGFIANAFPACSVDEANSVLEIIRKEYYDACHNPFAYVLSDSNVFRYYDDGEPSGSSGKPIYDAINKHDLKNVIVIVTRYFGGIKLGVGGLKRAYFEAASDCLDKSLKKEIVLKRPVEIEFEYKNISRVMQHIE